MLANRLKVVIILIPIGVAVIVLGGWAYSGLVTLMLGVAAWEYWRMFTRGGVLPIVWILIPGVALLAIARTVWGFEHNDLILSGLAMATMTVHTVLCEKGCKNPASDFGATIGGLIYLGFLGSYLISLRNLPGGMWWVLLTIPTIGIGDSGAFFIGRKFGRRPLAPMVSPYKTVEGYFGGLLFSILGGWLLAYLWGLRFTGIVPWHGLALGAVLGALTPLGDLGESMLKRQFGVKDTSGILPGHGGILDRMDTWIWGSVISYYVITWFF
jgi:phosphatidate cytidylyltransferase